MPKGAKHSSRYPHGPSIKWPRVYRALRRAGHSKSSAAAISNAHYNKYRRFGRAGKPGPKSQTLVPGWKKRNRARKAAGDETDLLVLDGVTVEPGTPDDPFELDDASFERLVALLLAAIPPGSLDELIEELVEGQEALVEAEAEEVEEEEAAG